MKHRQGFIGRGAAFTLIELLTVIGIVAILAGILLPSFGRVYQQSAQVKTLSNMRQMGAAMMLYVGENNYVLPGRVSNPPDGSTPVAKWPQVLKPYLQDMRVYSSPIPDAQGKSYKVTDFSLYMDTTRNYSSYIYNGMNDMGASATDPNAAPVNIRLNTVSLPAQTILLGIPYPQTGQFYMDFGENGGNNNDILNKNAFSTSAIYMFCDGSSRSLENNADSVLYKKKAPPNSNTYTDWLWLFDKSRSDVIQ